MSNTTRAEHNAVEFGNHVGAPGWYDGFLVACSVERGAGQGRNLAPDSDEKISLNAFAKKAHQRQATVSAYLDAWDSAAADELVPTADELTPADAEVGLDFAPEVHTAEVWADYFEPMVADKREQDRIYAQERRQGKPTEKQVVEAIKADPKIVAKAIKEDVRVSLTAREAVVERDRAKPKASPKQEAPIEQFGNLHIQLRSAKRALTEALGYVIDIRGVTDTDEVRAAVSGYVGQLRHVLDLIDEAAQGKSLDDELAELLMDEDLK